MKTSYYPFAAKSLRPGEVSEFALDFQLPFMLETFVACPDDAGEIVVKDILIGGRSLIVSGGVIPIEMFYEGCWPIKYWQPLVPPGTPLRMIVENTSAGNRSLQMSVVGYSDFD